jgi:hypothetical protein
MRDEPEKRNCGRTGPTSPEGRAASSVTFPGQLAGTATHPDVIPVVTFNGSGPAPLLQVTAEELDASPGARSCA